MDPWVCYRRITPHVKGGIVTGNASSSATELIIRSCVLSDEAPVTALALSPVGQADLRHVL